MPHYTGDLEGYHGVGKDPQALQTGGCQKALGAPEGRDWGSETDSIHHNTWDLFGATMGLPKVAAFPEDADCIASACLGEAKVRCALRLSVHSGFFNV